MTDPVAVLLGLNALVLLVVLVTLLRRRGSVSAGLLQQQLIELRTRLDQLMTTQREIPTVLAQGRAEQTTSLSAQFADLTRTVTMQLESAQHTVDERLSDAGLAVADVRERLGELSEVTKRLELLGRGVTNVERLLTVPHLRGALGEIWLEQILSQIFPESLYEIQYTFSTGERVDAVLKLGGRLVPVDSKFPLDACQRLLEGNGRGDPPGGRSAFRKAVRARIDEIADKYIQPQLGTYDFAMMYVPAERVFYEAVIRDQEVERDDSIMAYAMARKVIPVSPNTFYAYLAAVVHGLRGLRVEERAREILASLVGLQQELDKFQRTHGILGRHLSRASRHFDDAQASLSRIHERLRLVAGLPAPRS
jgi:DNA recombination protein RmuC